MVKILVEQEGIDINAKTVQFFMSKLILIIFDSKTIYSDSSNYYGQHLWKHLKKATQK